MSNAEGATTAVQVFLLKADPCCRCAREGQLVEVRNNDWWGKPALGTLGPPAEALQGSLGLRSDQQKQVFGCLLCKADDHLIKDCPLNECYHEERNDAAQHKQQSKQPKQKRAGCLALMLSVLQGVLSLLPFCALLQ